MCAIAGTCAVWLRPQPPPPVFRTIPTGASFNVSVMQSAVEASAHAVAWHLVASGKPAFVRSLTNGALHQVVVGPYASLEEAEASQRFVARHGFRGRVLVDESVRRVAGYDGMPHMSAGANVLLIAGAGRVAVVIELPSEPRHVVTRPAGERGLEIEAGPLRAAVKFQHWDAPAGVALLERVWVDEAGTGEGRGIRTRIAMSDSARASVRTAGRRVYIDLSDQAIDLSSDEASRRGPPYATLASAKWAFTARQTTNQRPLSLAPRLPDYRVTIRPAVAKFDAIEPFVLSAVGTPAPDAMSALELTLQALEDWMRAVRPPPHWQDTHYSLISAIALAGQAVTPEFTGDRIGRARYAFALRETAKASLNYQLPAAD